MSLLHIEFISTDQFIKDEIDIKNDPDEIFEMVHEDAAFVEEQEKCGDIFFRNGRYILACCFCTDHFKSLQEFDDHIQSQHISNEESDPNEETQAVLTDTETDTKFTVYTPSSPPHICKDTDMNSSPVLVDINASKVKTFTADPDLFCTICVRQYRDKRRFKEHQARHTNVKTLDCERLMDEKNPDHLKCKYCLKKCVDLLEWDEHKKTHTSGRYQCPYCPKTFRAKSQQTVHVNGHIGVKPYECDICHKTFTQVSNLKRHIRNHLGDKRFPCEICGKNFYHLSEKESHKRTHTGEKPFQCEECGNSYILQSKLTEHRKRHTNTKNFKCEICDKRFYSNHALKEHKIMHTNNRPHKCTECDRSFSRRKALISHRKIHSDRKEYVCNICGKEFAQAAGVYSHKKSHGEKLHSPLF